MEGYRGLFHQILQNTKNLIKPIDFIDFDVNTSKEQLLPYQRRRPNLSDLELIGLSLTAEFMGIDSENDLF